MQWFISIILNPHARDIRSFIEMRYYHLTDFSEGSGYTYSYEFAYFLSIKPEVSARIYEIAGDTIPRSYYIAGSECSQKANKRLHITNHYSSDMVEIIRQSIAPDDIRIFVNQVFRADEQLRREFYRRLLAFAGGDT